MTAYSRTETARPVATVAGIGIVTPFGLGIEANTAGISNGTPVTGEMTLFDPPEGAPEMVGEAPHFEIDDYVLSPKAYLDRSSELMFVAFSLALADAGIAPESIAGERTGLCFATTWGSADTLATFYSDYLERGPRRVKPFIFPHTYANTPISLAAMEYQAAGPHLCFAGGDAAGLQAVAAGVDLIQSGQADTVIAGAIDPLSPMRLQTAAATPDIPQGEAAILFLLRRQSESAQSPVLKLQHDAVIPSSNIIGHETLIGQLASANSCMPLATALLMQRAKKEASNEVNIRADEGRESDLCITIKFP